MMAAEAIDEMTNNNNAEARPGQAEVCVNCGKGGGLWKCEDCELVKYCSCDCQDEHWEQHSAACEPRAAELKEYYKQTDFHIKELHDGNKWSSSESMLNRLNKLRECIGSIPEDIRQDVIKKSFLLCENKFVSLEIVHCLLEYVPEGASVEIGADGGALAERLGYKYDCGDDEKWTAYPLHFACLNKDCPNEVIAFLVEECPAALQHFTLIDDHGVGRNRDPLPGLPLHYYLARSANIDMDTIVMLVNAYPKSLTAWEIIGCCGDMLRPIDMLLRERSLGFPAIRSYCETQYLTLEGIRERINQIPTDLFNDILEHYNFLHFVCQNECVTLEVVEYLLSDEYDPNAASRTIDARAHFDSTAYALHYACANKDCPNSVIELLIKKNPSALSHACVVHLRNNFEGDYSYGELKVHLTIPELVGKQTLGLPLSYYLRRETNVDLNIVKLLVNTYPDSLTEAGPQNELDLYSFTICLPFDILMINAHNISNSFEISQFLLETDKSFLRSQIGSRVSWKCTSLDIACLSHDIDPRLVGLIVSACPKLIGKANDYNGGSCAHLLCHNDSMPEQQAAEILALLTGHYPTLAKIINRDGYLPIHLAAGKGRSPQFCKLLLGGYPESTRLGCECFEHNRGLPLQLAAYYGHLDTAKCLYDADPTTLEEYDTNGTIFFESDEIMRPTGMINDAEDEDMITDSAGRHWWKIAAMLTFLEQEWAYLVKAKDTKSLVVQDGHGRTYLHNTIRYYYASLGCIKLLVKGNPDSLLIVDNDGYSPLHTACHRGKCDVVSLILGEDNAFVSVRSNDGKLPIQLLCEASNVDRDSIEYVEATWLLIRHHPEILSCLHL